MEPFPYKKEFLNFEQLWKNMMTLDLTVPEPIQVPAKWWPPARNIPYQFQGLPKGWTIGLIVADDVYEKVNSLVDYFTEEARMKARRKDCISPYDFYQEKYPELMELAKEFQKTPVPGMIWGPNLPFRHYLREAIYRSTKECTNFKIATSKAIFKYFHSQMVLDPSAGWGDRVLGAIAAGVQVYHGIDPNSALRKGYDEILQTIRERTGNQDYALITEDFLKVELQEEAYDTVFTSPPYFDYEIYSEETNQSIVGKPTVDLWLKLFLFPYLTKAVRSLVKGGFLVLYISDTKYSRYTKEMHEYIIKDLRMGFLGIMAMAHSDLGYGYPIWCYQK